MTTSIYIDALNGYDSQGNGSSSNPYKTLEYFCNYVAVKTDGDYTVYLKRGTYEIVSNNIFGQFTSGNLTIIGLGEQTEILQKTGMYANSTGGNANFTLNIAKCRYNILTSLTSYNLIGFYWKWNFYNVLFEFIPDNSYSVFSSSTSMIIRNCVKLTNSTSFLRKNSSTISVYDSMGYFTSGYSTSQSDWDKGGNSIGSVGDYVKVLKEGLYKWNTCKTFILHDGEYKKFIQKIEEITGLDNAIPKMGSNTAPSGVASASSVSSGDYSAWKAFDKSTAGIGWIASTRTGWLQYQFPTKRIIVRYGVTNPSSASTASYATRAPKDWEFLGSNDGANWDTLDTKTNQTNWGSAERREFTIMNSKSYLYYRINVTANNNAGDMAINELEMYEQPVAPENAYWSTISNFIPSSQQFLEQGMDNLSPLLERTITQLEPMTMINKSEILNGDTGKVFSKVIDLKKYIDIRNIRTEVR